MSNYAFNVVATDSRAGSRPVTWHRGPRAFAGTADQFAQAVLRDVMSRDPRLSGELVVVNVWDSDREGVFVPHDIAGRAFHDPHEPQRPDEIPVGYFTYYVSSAEYAVMEDAVLGADGTARSHGICAGLIVPGAGPVLQIMTGHQYGWITLHTSWYEREPEPDLAAWEAVEQVTIRPQGPVRVYSQEWVLQEHYPDLAGGLDPEYLTIRVSARGRDEHSGERGRDPSRPGERHRIQAWSAAAPAPRLIIKRDQTSRYWEDAGAATPRNAT
jgi:hypothetical protein